jgi:hemoglobin/transferrin/lactoferrin receptor protein
MKNIRQLLFVIFFFISSSIFANETKETEEIIVIASRIPTLASDVIGSVESISSAELEAQMANGLEQIVRYMPGVSAHNESQYGRTLTEDVQIRGIRGGAIFLIDGIRISDSYTGYGRDTVDVDLLKKVEIMKGPSSVEYGSDGLAGTIAYFTKDPTDLVNDGRYLSITTSYIEKSKQEKVNILAAYDKGSNSGLIQLVDRSLEETKLHEDFSLKANPMDGGQQSIFGKLNIDLSSESKLTFVVDLQEWESEWVINSEKGFIYFPAPRSISSSSGDDEGTRERFSISLNLSNANKLYDSAELSYYAQETEQSQITIQNQVSFLGGIQAAPTPTMRIRDFDFNQSINGFAFEAYKSSGNYQMVYGLDIEDTETERPRMLSEINLITGMATNIVDGETYPNKTFPDSETKRKAVFFNNRISLSDSSALTLGFRYDDYELNISPDILLSNANILNYQINNTEDSAFSFKLGYLKDLSEDLRGFIQYAEGFKAPDYESSNTVFTNYLYFYTVIPNPDLESEESDTLEIGLRGSREQDSWELALYQSEVDGFIHPEAIGFNRGLGIYQYQNAENVEIRGIEFDYERSLTEQLSLKLALAISSGDLFEGNEKYPLPEIDPKELILGLNWIPTNDKFSLQALLTLSGKSKDNLEEVCLNNDCWPRVQTSGFALLDIFTSYVPNDNLEFRLALENLTDKKYLRWASVSQLPANDSELDLYGQNGRSISASFKYTF